MAKPPTTKCRGQSCDAEISWVECVRRDGRLNRIPLDPDPVKVLEELNPQELKGKFVFIEDDRIRGAVCGDHAPFFESHFNTCPDADDFRGSK